MSAVLQHKSITQQQSSTTLSLAFDAPVTAGNLIVAVVLSEGGLVSAITEDGQNLTLASAVPGSTAEIWYGIAPSSGAVTVTATFGGTNDFGSGHLHIYEIQSGYSTLDASGTSSNSFSVSTSGPTGFADEVVIAAFVNGSINETMTPPSNEGSELTQAPVGASTVLSFIFEVTSEETITATASGSNASGIRGVIATFYNPNGGGGTISGPFLGSVTVVASGPKGNGPYLGKLSVVSSGPKGTSSPYLGEVVIGNPPSGESGPSLGTVVVLGAAPGGKPGPFLGTVTEV